MSHRYDERLAADDDGPQWPDDGPVLPPAPGGRDPLRDGARVLLLVVVVLLLAIVARAVCS